MCPEKGDLDKFVFTSSHHHHHYDDHDHHQSGEGSMTVLWGVASTCQSCRLPKIHRFYYDNKAVFPPWLLNYLLGYLLKLTVTFISLPLNVTLRFGDAASPSWEIGGKDWKCVDRSIKRCQMLTFWIYSAWQPVGKVHAPRCHRSGGSIDVYPRARSSVCVTLCKPAAGKWGLRWLPEQAQTNISITPRG